VQSGIGDRSKAPTGYRRSRSCSGIQPGVKVTKGVRADWAVAMLVCAGGPIEEWDCMPHCVSALMGDPGSRSCSGIQPGVKVTKGVRADWAVAMLVCAGGPIEEWDCMPHCVSPLLAGPVGPARVEHVRFVQVVQTSFYSAISRASLRRDSVADRSHLCRNEGRSTRSLAAASPR